LGPAKPLSTLALISAIYNWSPLAALRDSDLVNNNKHRIDHCPSGKNDTRNLLAMQHLLKRPDLGQDPGLGGVFVVVERVKGIEPSLLA